MNVGGTVESAAEERVLREKKKWVGKGEIGEFELARTGGRGRARAGSVAALI